MDQHHLTTASPSQPPLKMVLYWPMLGSSVTLPAVIMTGSCRHLRAATRSLVTRVRLLLGL